MTGAAAGPELARRASGPAPGGPPPSERQSVYIPALDGARALAVFLVIVYHSVHVGWARSVVRVGWSGVDLFFVLSGFLITGILIDAKGAAGYFRAFYARRTLRILPLYYAVLALFFVVVPHVPRYAVPAWRIPVSEQIWYWAYLANVPRHWTFLQVEPYVGHFWTLSVEEQFYVVWPMVVLLTPRRWFPGVCLGVVAVSAGLRVFGTALGVSSGVMLGFTPFRADGLALGAWLATVVRGPKGLDRLRGLAAPLAWSAGALAVVAIVVGRRHAFEALHWSAQLFAFPATALASGALIAAIMTRPRWESRFSRPVLRAAGRISYGMYVFSLPVSTILERRLQGLSASPAGQWLFAAIVLTVTTVLALVSWHLFEKRFLALKRFVPYGRAPLIDRTESALPTSPLPV